MLISHTYLILFSILQPFLVGLEYEKVLSCLVLFPSTLLGKKGCFSLSAIGIAACSSGWADRVGGVGRYV